MARLSRKQQQERTRSSLMGAAAKVFCRKGLDRASIDEVAEEAGYTKGAFYANFKSKDELFLAMLDASFTERIAETERAFAEEGEAPDQARRAAADLARFMHSHPEHARLFLEYSSHALRDDDFRQELLTRFATLRERLDRIYARRLGEYGLDPPVPIERITRMVIAMADGWSLWHLLEPDAVDEELLESMMEAFTIGVGAMAGIFDREARPGDPAPS